MTAIGSSVATDSSSIRHKRIAFDAAVWQALHRLSLDSAKSVQQLADEAFRDLLKKHRRPITLSEALKESLRMQPANDRAYGDSSSPASATLGSPLAFLAVIVTR
jgi:Antitoxin-like ribbon-helix-helix